MAPREENKNIDTGTIVFQDVDDCECNKAHIFIAYFLSDGSQNFSSIFLIKTYFGENTSNVNDDNAVLSDLGNNHHSFSFQTQNHNGYC